MLSQPVRVALVDDHILFAKILRTYLEEQPDISIAVQATNMLDLIQRIKYLKVDILIMDLSMPGLCGIEAVKRIREEFPDIKILVLSMSQDIELISDLLELGIYGYISKSDEPDNLILAIHTVSGNHIYHNKLFAEALYCRMKKNIKMRAMDELNEREKLILMLIWNEKGNKEIADELFLGLRSVEKIKKEIKEKIGVKSTVGLLKYAIDNKIIRVNTLNPDLIR